MDVHVPDHFGGWHAQVLACLARMYEAGGGALPADALQQVLAAMAADPLLAGVNQKALKQMGGWGAAGAGQAGRQAGRQARGCAVRRAGRPQVGGPLVPPPAQPSFPPTRLFHTPAPAVMPFAKYRCELSVKGGAAVLQDRLPFDELALLQENKAFLLRRGRQLCCAATPTRRISPWLLRRPQPHEHPSHHCPNLWPALPHSDPPPPLQPAGRCPTSPTCACTR